MTLVSWWMWAGVKLELKVGDRRERSGGEAGKVVVSPEGEEGGLLMLPSPPSGPHPPHPCCFTPHKGSKWATCANDMILASTRNNNLVDLNPPTGKFSLNVRLKTERH